jgi:DMSO/TMAO reductase YedYZ molybdopterin-dependent catalytic subunit
MDEPHAAPDETPVRNSRLRYSRRRFLKMAGGLAAGLAAVASFGYWARDKVAPQGTVTSGGGGPQDTDRFFAEFPVRSIEEIPRVRPEQWLIQVDGLVTTPLSIDYEAWQKLPRLEQTVDFHCVEGWSVDDVGWDGVRLSALLDQAQPLAEASVVRFHAEGGKYQDDLTLEQARDPAVVLADTVEGRPLPPEHGGPVRLIVPSQLGYKSVKWVVRIELDDERRKGYWEEYGYPIEAPIPEAQRRATE